MRRLLIYFGLMHLALSANGQYVPYSNQMFQYAASYNPAFTGVDPFTEIKLGYRSQWTGFGADGPKFANIVLNTRLKQPLDLRHNALRTSDVDALKPANLPRGKRIFHGLGFNVFKEQVSVVHRTGGVVNYALHYPLSSRVHLATGLSAAVDNMNLRTEKLYLGVSPDPDTYYNDLISNGVSQTDLNVRAGLLLYTQNFYVGLSYYDLLHSQLSASESNYNNPHYRGSGQIGFSLPLSSSLVLKPSAFALWQTDDSFTLDYNLKMYIDHRMWFGLTYRGTESLVAIGGFNFNHVFSVAYSYEQSTGAMKQFSDGSHEMILLLRLNNLKRLQSNIW